MKNSLRWRHREVWRLAWPMILSNVSTPLLGMVDTAVMGHQDSARYLGAVALGGLLFSFLYWGFGFLRMGTTGLVAQAFGRDDHREVRAVLVRSLALALALAAGLVLLQSLWALIGFWLIDGDPATKNMALRYYAIRIWSAPATLSLYVLAGWFLGMQNVRSSLLVVVTTNVCNIGLDLLLVMHWHFGVSGVAWATVLAEYTGLALAVFLSGRVLRGRPGPWPWRDIADAEALRSMLAINTDLFIRTFSLILAFAFFTAQGARLGSLVLAANSVLLNFQMFMAFALDGFAHAVEALVGRAKGGNDMDGFRQAVATAGLWSLFGALGFSGFYALFGADIIDMLTSLTSVRSTAYAYLPWVIALPLVSFVCYWLDGVFIGATRSRAMRNTMLFSLFGVFIPSWYLAQTWGNHGLWLALSLFMAARGLSMAWVYVREGGAGWSDGK